MEFKSKLSWRHIFFSSLSGFEAKLYSLHECYWRPPYPLDLVLEENEMDI